MNPFEVRQLIDWTTEQVQKAKTKSRTVNQMKVMWRRIKDWADRSNQRNIESWGPEMAIQVIYVMEKETSNPSKLMTWASLNNALVIFRKSMVEQGYHDWHKDGAKYKMAKTTLKRIINDESKTSISKHRVTKKQSSDISKAETEMVAMKLFLRTRERNAYQLLRKCQYASWVFSVNTGMRLQDVVRLQWSQIRVENGEIRQRINYSKSDLAGRKLDEIVIKNGYDYPCDLQTAFNECISIKKGLNNQSDFLLPKSTNIQIAANPGSLSEAWNQIGKELKLKTEIGAKTPKMSFLNKCYGKGKRNKAIHLSANWGKSPDIRRHYIASESGLVAQNED